MSKKLLFNFNREAIQNYTYVKYVGTIITATNTLEKPIKSASLKGSTKYRDIDTGEFLETFEEGRNLELVSVKMPVLMTTGKNLLKTKTATFNFEGNKQVSELVGYVKVEKNKRYTVSFSFQKNIDANSSGGVEIVGCNDIPEESLKYWYASNDSRCKLFNKNSSITEKSTINNFKYTIPSDHDVNYIAIYCGSYFKEYVGIVENVQIETGTTATSYEPHKSNSLTTPSDLVMRSNGDICDTLDLITGQFTQRIDENGEVLAQEIIKTVDLSILDQNENKVSSISSFNDTTHITASSETIPPIFEGYLATKEVE